MDKITAAIRRKIVKENLFKEKKYSAHDDLWLRQIFLLFCYPRFSTGDYVRGSSRKKNVYLRFFVFDVSDLDPDLIDSH